MLLDSGLRTDESLRSLEAALRSLDLAWESITEILISHMHPDHVGAAAEIRRRSQAPIRMHSLEALYVQPLGPDRKYFAATANFLLRNGNCSPWCRPSVTDQIRNLKQKSINML